MAIIWCWSILLVLLFCSECVIVGNGYPLNRAKSEVEWSSGGVLALIGISVTLTLSLVVVVALCVCCYPRNSADDSDSDDQSKYSDDQGDERKQLTMQQSNMSVQSRISSKKAISFPWTTSDQPVTVKGIQPDQFGLVSVNRLLGITGSETPTPSESHSLAQPNTGFAVGSSESSSALRRPDEQRFSDSQLHAPESPLDALNLGRIQFRLGYDFQQMTLTLKLISASNLPAKDFSGTSDPYVKIYLLPDRKHKLTSNVKRKCLNPYWNEVFTFEGFPYSKLVNKSLYLQVVDYDRFSRDDPIGEVILPLNDINLINGETLWKELQPCVGHVGQLGELQISLCYNPTKGEIFIIILKARQLKAKDINGLSDPYVKIWRLHDGRKMEKRKTKVHQKTLDPEFNEPFKFNVPFEQIRHTSLMISVMDHDFIGTNERIGQILLGCKSSPSEAKHWNEMLTKPRKYIEKWHMLKDLD